MNFEPLKSHVTQSSFAIGYKIDEFQVHANLNDRPEFGDSIYQKVNKKLEIAISLSRTARKSNTHFRTVVKYQVGPDASFWPNWTAWLA